MIKKLILLFLTIFPLITVNSQDYESKIYYFNEDFTEKVLILSNINDSELSETILNFIEKNLANIPYKITYAQIYDDLYNNNLKGSDFFLSNQLTDIPRIALYFNIDSDLKPEVYAFNNRHLPDLNITKTIFNNLEIEELMCEKLPLTLTSIIKNPRVLNKYLEWGVPLILFRGDIDPEKVLSSIVGDKSIESEKNLYYLLSIFNRVIYLDDLTVIGIITIFLIMLIVLTTLYTKRIKFHLKHNLKYFITLPLKIVFVFIFYYIGTLITEYIFELSGDNKFLYNYPLSIFIIKNMILYFIYGICFHIIKDTSFSKSPHFYSIISFYLSMIICFLLSLIYLPLGLFQIWPIIMTIIFISTKKRSRRRTCLLLSPLFLILFFIHYLNSDNREFINLFISSRYRGNLFLALLSAPYLFLQDSYHRFTTRRKNRVIYQKDIIFSILLLTSIITYVAILIEI